MVLEEEIFQKLKPKFLTVKYLMAGRTGTQLLTILHLSVLQSVFTPKKAIYGH